ncbi:M66 family metalloprotease [Actinoplanes sp. NPDC051859]|uniref:M66 family metalloprotease n=1 Tax=Actinoplanes sp. NPDC051859 TaxID=3363909 RepID=UPI0037A5FC33
MVARVLRWLTAAAVSGALLWQPSTVAAAGEADAYAFLSQRSGFDLVARWNPCAPIGYRVNLDRAPRESLTEVQVAVARIAAATGLTFSYAGPTQVVPGRTPVDYPPDTQLIIAWGTPETDKTDIAGIGGAVYSPGQTESGAPALIIDKGMVLLDAARTASMARGFGAAGNVTTGQLLLHELGHAVGLAHPLVDDPTEIMYPWLSNRATTWGAGDLAGLREVGANGGCLHHDPAPATV